MSGPSIASLCTGYGGLDDAVLNVFGGRIAWYCQYDPEDTHQYAAQIMARRAPGVPNLGDITAVDYGQVEPVDILTAGWPCQDMSLAGKRAGLIEGNRSGLWFHVARAIKSLRPNLVILENVRGLLSAPADSNVEFCPWCLGAAGDGEPAVRALGVVLADLAELGFDAEWQGLPASDVGACHQRYRVCVLAWPADTEGEERTGPRLLGRVAQHRAAAADADDLGGDRRPALGGEAGREVPSDDTAADAAGLGHGHAGTPGERGLPAAAVTDGAAAIADTSGDGRLEGGAESARIERRSDTAVGGEPDWGQYADAVRRWERVLGRPAPGPVDDRGRLNPAFVEWMQGLDKGHVAGLDGIPRSAQLKALGNGVVPQWGAAAIRILLARAFDLQATA